MNALDTKFVDSLTAPNIRNIFERLEKSKTDIISGEICLARGCDKITHKMFFDNIDHHISLICEKGKSGKYLFMPFKERKEPKPPFTCIEEAEKEGERIGKPGKYIRILSVSTIQDTVFQKLLADAINDHVEVKFRNSIDLHSYGYRKGKSSKLAVKRIKRFVDEGYLHVLDGDIRGFFDEIDHSLLVDKMCAFFGDENELIQKFLRRFIHVDKIPPGGMKYYNHEKRSPVTKRLRGIPQGGVLSGLLANVFLFDFDSYVINNLMPKYNFRYFRYADDFVLMFRDKTHIDEVYKLIKNRLNDIEGLFLHEIGDKTKRIDLTPAGVGKFDFLGFEISPKHLRIKKTNVKKFINRIRQTLEEIDETKFDDKFSWESSYFWRVVKNINHKIVGLEDSIEQRDGICPSCKLPIKKRSWMGYFVMVTDVRQLRNIDKLVRTEIYRDYHRRMKIRQDVTNTHIQLKHVRKKEMLSRTLAIGLKSIEKQYYIYRKQAKKHKNLLFCECLRFYDAETEMLRVKEN